MSIKLNKMKNLIYLILVCVGIVLTALCLHTCRNAHNFKEVRQQAAIHRYDSVRYWRDRWNTEHAVVADIRGELATVKVLEGRKLDSVCKRLHLREKQLKDMSEVLVRAQGRITEVPYPVYIPYRDSGRAVLAFDWADEYLEMRGWIDSNMVQVDYAMTLKINTASYWRRKHPWAWILSKKRYYFDGWCDNPAVTIKGLKSIKIN